MRSFLAALAILGAGPAITQPAASDTQRPVRTVADAIKAIEEHAASKPKLLNPGQVLTGDDYPQEALEKDEQGTAHIRLTINPEGRVTECAVEKSTGSRSLDATSCRLYAERARYEPVAENEWPRVVHHQVKWAVFTAERGRSRNGWFQRTSFVIRKDGAVLSCLVESSDAADVNCSTPQPFAKETAAKYVKAVGNPAKLISEMRYAPEGESPEPPRIRTGFPLRSAKLVVKSDGSLRSCEVLEPGTSPKDSLCREVAQYPFEKLPDASDQTGIVRIWTYLEPGPKS
jgi:TonB family protein